MDEAERCTDVGFIDQGRLLAKAAPRAFKSSFNAKLLEIDIDPVMEGLVRLREVPDVWGFPAQRQSADLRRGTGTPGRAMEEQMAFPGSALARRTLGRAGHGRCLYRLLAGIWCALETAQS